MPFKNALIQLPIGITKIGVSSFEDCKSLQYIDIPSSVIEIQRNAFWNCKSLKSLDLSQSSIQIIGVYAFAYCELERITFPPAESAAHSPLVEIRDGAFHWNTGLTTVWLPEGVKVIGKDAFSRCESLVNINIPSTVNEIAKGCFDGCSSLRSIEVAVNHLMWIGSFAFHNCTSLRNIFVPPSVQYIGEGAFHGCSDLESGIAAGGVDRNQVDIPLRQRLLELSNHQLCYFQSSMAPIFRECDLYHLQRIENTAASEDLFGMTPFHILALSVQPNISLFQSMMMMQDQPRDYLTRKDYWGWTCLDYMCCNTAPQAVELLECMIQWTITPKLGWLGLSEWKDDLRIEIYVLLTMPRTGEERKRQLDLLQCKLVKYERLEAISLLESAVWKFRIMMMMQSTIGDDDNVQLTPEDRRYCRISCGADFVVVNVLPFLGRAPRRSSIEAAQVEDIEVE